MVSARKDARLAHTLSAHTNGTRAAGAGVARFGLACALLGLLAGSSAPGARRESENVSDVTGKYHFLSADDVLAMLEEEGKLKGYIDVYQSEEESDAVLSYPIVSGTHQDNRVQFKTGTIHQKYYVFSGIAERGGGKKESDPDYLRLAGDLEIITKHADTGAESIERRRVMFKSIGKNEDQENQ